MRLISGGRVTYNYILHYWAMKTNKVLSYLFLSCTDNYPSVFEVIMSPTSVISKERSPSGRCLECGRERKKEDEGRTESGSSRRQKGRTVEKELVN